MEGTLDYLSLYQAFSHESPEFLQSGLYHFHQEKSCISLWLIMSFHAKSQQSSRSIPREGKPLLTWRTKQEGNQELYHSWVKPKQKTEKCQSQNSLPWAFNKFYYFNICVEAASQHQYVRSPFQGTCQADIRWLSRPSWRACCYWGWMSKSLSPEEVSQSRAGYSQAFGTCLIKALTKLYN